MGNGQSRDKFSDVLPSDPGGAASSSTKSVSIAEAWSAGSDRPSAAEDVLKSPNDPLPVVKKILPPGHALQLQETITSRLSTEASEVVRAFQNLERSDDRFVVPESVRKSRTVEAFADVCSEILPGFLYVSNLRVARDAAKLRALGITHVINCCGELKHYEDGVEMPSASCDSEFDILKLLLRDDANEDLTPFLPQVIEYIANCRQRTQLQESLTKDKVLVHCHQGVSRSCAFAIAYVMLERQLSYYEAAAMVKRQRAITSPNAAFICQLLEWEKDLQAMRADDIIALGGLQRLAPHSNYDPGCLVLKRCFDSSAGSSRQRQHIASVKTLEDEQRLLWSQGTFVFQSPAAPTDLVVWCGAKCAIPDAASTAAKLAEQLLRLQRLVRPSSGVSSQRKVVKVRENTDGHIGTDVDHFGYGVELEWNRDSAVNTHQLQTQTTGMVTNNYNVTSDSPRELSTSEASAPPQLFILEAIGEHGGEDLWDQLKNYDSEDLTPDSAFLLCSLAKSCVWIGTNCTFTPEAVVEAAQKQLQHLYGLPESMTTPSLMIECQNKESDAFWELFEAGY